MPNLIVPCRDFIFKSLIKGVGVTDSEAQSRLKHSAGCSLYSLLTTLFLANSSFNTIPLGPDRLPSSVQTTEVISPSAPTIGRSDHVHSRFKSSSNFPSSASTTFSPMTGRNLKAWPLPPVARKSEVEV